MSDLTLDTTPPEGIYHYTDISKVPWDCQKYPTLSTSTCSLPIAPPPFTQLTTSRYFQQRRTLFSRYHHGIWLTPSAWFGVTPEPVARAIASHITHHYLGLDLDLDLDLTTTSSTPPPIIPNTILVDAFAGAGGNTIAFAQHTPFERIIGIENDAQVLACAQHNAHKVYGVPWRRIEWLSSSCFEVLKYLRGELRNKGYEDEELATRTKTEPPKKTIVVVFGSPPWGGVGYEGDAGKAPKQERVFDLEAMQPYGLKRLVDGLSILADDDDESWEETRQGGLVLYLPRGGDLRQLAALGKQATPGDDEAKMQVVHYCVRGASKAMCVFLNNDQHLKEWTRRMEISPAEGTTIAPA